MLLELRVFGRRSRRLVFLLQEWIEVVLFVLVRGCEMRAGPVLPVPLVPLRSPQAVLLLLAEFKLARVALAHRDASPDFARLGAVLFFVACKP